MIKHYGKLAITLAATCLGNTYAYASVTTYSDPLNFQSTASVTVLDLNGFGPGYYGNPGILDLGPLSITSSAPLFTQATNALGTGSFISTQQENPISLLLTLDSPATAFGFNYSVAVPFNVSLDGQLASAPASPFPGLGFIGFTSPTAFSTIAIQLNADGLDLDNLAFGNTNALAPVPEPATWAMMIAGIGMVGAAMRRRGISAGGKKGTV